jgi:hypothetical protein
MCSYKSTSIIIIIIIIVNIIIIIISIIIIIITNYCLFYCYPVVWIHTLDWFRHGTWMI